MKYPAPFLMKITNNNELVLMHGPAFDESGKIVERKIAAVDVRAFRQAGYELGPIPKITNPAPAAETPKVTARKAK